MQHPPIAPAGRPVLHRRRVLAGLGAGAVGAAFAGPFAGRALAQAGGGFAAASVELVAHAQAVELGAAEVSARIADELGDDEVAQLVRAFSRHHREHAGAMHALVGVRGADGPDQAVLGAYSARVTGGRDRLLEAAFDLEQRLAATHLFALGALEEQDPAFTVASILPVETSHAVVLGQLVGVPEAEVLPSFERVDDAFLPAVVG